MAWFHALFSSGALFSFSSASIIWVANCCLASSSILLVLLLAIGTEWISRTDCSILSTPSKHFSSQICPSPLYTQHLAVIPDSTRWQEHVGIKQKLPWQLSLSDLHPHLCRHFSQCSILSFIGLLFFGWDGQVGKRDNGNHSVRLTPIKCMYPPSTHHLYSFYQK